jgi:hypothetical protein
MSVETHIKITEKGEEIHTCTIDRPEANASHQFVEIVHAAIQGTIAGMPAPGITASVGIEKDHAIQHMNDGISAEVLADRVRDAVLSQWVQNALDNGRLQHVTRQAEVDGKVLGISTVQGVIFTDQQFSEFLIDLETQMLNACDTAVAIALASHAGITPKA